MSLYLYYFKMHFKSRMEYKLSFLLSCISQMFMFFTYYFIIYSLFLKFDNLKGYTVYEVMLTFSIIQFGYAFNEVFFRGIDQFDKLIVKGDYDRLLLRPRSILLQVFGFEIGFERIIKLVESIIVLIIALIKLKLELNSLKILTIILMLISSISIFFGLFLLAASYCFITIEGLEVRNVFTDGGKHMSIYPISIFSKKVMLFFTFIIPYAFVNYYPFLYVVGRSQNKIYSISPLITLLYLIPCFIIFNIGSKKYKSTGS